jgi:hypothetical protein
MLFHKITTIMAKNNNSHHSQTLQATEDSSNKLNKTLHGGYRKKQLQSIEY